MALYIELGTVIDADWKGLLAYSDDGVNWSTINISGASVKGHIITGNTDSPLVDNAVEAHLSIISNSTEILHIPLDSIANQPTWTNDQAGLNLAITDLADMIGTATVAAAGGGGGSATEATLLNVAASLDQLELSADTVNLNVDGLETLVGTTNTLLTTLDAVVDSIDTTITSIDTKVATEATIELLRLRLVDILGKLTLIEADTDAINTNTSGTVETPDLLTTSIAGTIAAGASTVSIFNSGNASGTVLGATLLKGLAVSYQVSDLNNTLSAIAYDATGTTFVISETR